MFSWQIKTKVLDSFFWPEAGAEILLRFRLQPKVFSASCGSGSTTLQIWNITNPFTFYAKKCKDLSSIGFASCLGEPSGDAGGADCDPTGRGTGSTLSGSPLPRGLQAGGCSDASGMWRQMWLQLQTVNLMNRRLYHVLYLYRCSGRPGEVGVQDLCLHQNRHHWSVKSLFLTHLL